MSGSGRSKAVEYSVRLKEILHQEENSKAVKSNEARNKKIEQCFELVDNIVSDPSPMSQVLGRLMKEIKDAVYRLVIHKPYAIFTQNVSVAKKMSCPRTLWPEMCS